MPPQLFETLAWPCADCPFIRTCGAARTPQRCRSDAPRPGPSEHELTLTDPLLDGVLRDIGGFEFGHLELAQPRALDLPQYLPQVRRDGRQGMVRELAVVAVRIHEVIRDGWVLDIEEFRWAANLSNEAEVIVLWFEEDRWLERRDSESGDLLFQLAGAGYTAVTAPSFPTYTNRSRLEYMKNTKRSFNYVVAGTSTGLHMIPHLALNVPHDVSRFAEVLNRNPSISTVALDIGCEMKAGNDLTLPLLRDLDILTGFKLQYLIAGVGASIANIRKVGRRIPLDRVTLTDSSPVTGRPDPGTTRADFFRAELERRNELIRLGFALSSPLPTAAGRSRHLPARTQTDVSAFGHN